jgi:hypothetical protein
MPADENQEAFRKNAKAKGNLGLKRITGEKMHEGYEDILEAARVGGKEPVWWDENGTPRFAPFTPRMCPDIYAGEVALLRIRCAGCGEEFDVQVSYNEHDKLIWGRDIEPLSANIEAIHYGDPPYHEGDSGQCAGTTMNCEDLRVIEFWQREWDWQRRHDLEIELSAE